MSVCVCVCVGGGGGTKIKIYIKIFRAILKRVEGDSEGMESCPVTKLLQFIYQTISYEAVCKSSENFS